MNVGMVGLGKMGMGMGARLARAGHTVAGFDLDTGKQAEAGEKGITWADSLATMPNVLPAPRVVIIMVPHGDPVDKAIEGILPGLAKGDIITDGGNSCFRDSITRAEDAASKGVDYLDAGISGGVWGEQEGYCIMVGGDRAAYDRAEQVFRDLSAPHTNPLPEGEGRVRGGGYAYVGPSGAGHFAKMVHNGIEYGMLQAYGEGFEILKMSRYDYDFETLAKLWNHGSVIRSWLLELAERAFAQSGDLEHVRGWVEDSGEGRWTVVEAIAERVPAPVIALSLMMRFRSRQDDPFDAKFIAALRHQFGGHEVKHE